MPAVLKSDTINGRKTQPIPNASGQIIAHRDAIAIAAVLGAGDILQVLDLPEDCVPDSIVLDTDDVSAGADITMSVGLLDAAGTDLDTTASGGAAWLTSSTVGQAGGAAEQDAAGLKAIARCAAAATSRKVGIKVVVAATTTTTGTVGLLLRYRAKS